MQKIIYKKQHKKKSNYLVGSNYVGVLQYGAFGLKASVSGVLTFKQVETARRVIAKVMERSGKIFIRVFFSHPLTKKPLLTRMGKGMGALKEWVVLVKKGMVIVEVESIKIELGFKALNAASLRLPVKTYVIQRDVWG
jgi:large subunit ribosomal protein L16